MSRYRDPQHQVGKNYIGGLHLYNRIKRYDNLTILVFISSSKPFLLEDQQERLKTAEDTISTLKVNFASKSSNFRLYNYDIY